MMRSLAVLLPLAAFSMGQFVSPPILTLGTPSDTTVCGSVTITWNWTGSNKASTVLITNEVPENEVSTSQPVPPAPYNTVIGVTIDLAAGSFIWQQAAVPRGWYAFKIFDEAVGGTVSAQSASFLVEGGTIPTCALVTETGTVGRGPTSDGFPTATPGPVPSQAPGGTTPNDGNPATESSGGINAGVIAGIVLGALAGIAIAGVLFFFLCRRRGRGFIRASRAFGKLDAEAKGSAGKSGHGRWGGLGSVDVTTAANQAKASPAGSDEAAQKDFPFSSSTANGGSTAAQSKLTLADEKTENEDDNPFKEPVMPSLRSQPSGTFVQEESRVASPVSRTTSPRPAPPPPPARRGSVLSSSSSSQDHSAPPSSPPLTAQRRVSVGAKGPPPPITPRANRSNTGPKTPTMSPRTRAASLKDFVDQNQGYQMAAYSLNNGSGQDEQALYSRLSNMPALAHAIPTAIITTPPRPPSTIGLSLTQPRRKPAPVYDIEMKGKPEGESSASTSTSGLGLSIGHSMSGTNASSATLGNGNAAALGSGTGIGLAADGDGPVHYLIPDMPPPPPRSR